MPREDYHEWCRRVRALGGPAAAVMDLAELEIARHDAAAKLCKRPSSKNHVRRSFYDVVGGMRQLGAGTYELYDDFTPHLLGLSRPVQVFLFPVVKEGCERYGRARVQAPGVGAHPPTDRTPQEWKWGPQDVLLTPAGKRVVHVGSALALVSHGRYLIPKLGIEVLTRLGDRELRAHLSTLEGKAELVAAVRASGVRGSVLRVA